MNSRVAQLLALFALATLLPAQSPPSADQALERYLRAAGGRRAWQKVKTVARTGAALPGISNLPLETAAAAPDRWAFQLRLPNGRSQAHAASAGRGWESAPAVKFMDDGQFLEESLLYDPLLPLTLSRYFTAFKVTGKQKNGNREVWVVEATSPKIRARTLYFDISTGLLTRAGRITFDDYRKVGGLMMPFLIRYGWQTFEYSEIALDALIDDARFKTPEAPVVKVQGPPPGLPDAGFLLERCLESMGGEAAVRKLQTQVRKGSGREGDLAFGVEILARRPGQWQLTFLVEGRVVDRQGFDGTAAWQQSGQMTKDLAARDRAESESLARFDFPLLLKEAGTPLAVVNKEKRDGREVYLVEARLPDRRAMLRFDAGTGLLHGIDNTAFLEYRAIDGVKVPSRVAFQNGHIVMEFPEIRHNESIDDAVFRRPPPGPGFADNFAGLEDAAAVTLLKQAFGQGVTPFDGRALYDVIVKRGYKRAVEVGTARGYSSLWFALAMKNTGGRLTTIEIDPETADEALANFRKARLDPLIDLRINDGLREIPAIKGQFDFAFLDSGSPVDVKLFALLSPRILPGGAIAAHNANAEFLKTAQAEPGFETAIVRTPTGRIAIATRKR